MIRDIYIELFHGRTDPKKCMDDWGTEGPILGPFKFCHITYFSGWLKVGDDIQIHCHKDMVYYDGVFYGDFSILSGGSIKDDLCLRKRIEKFNPEKANIPEQYTKKEEVELMPKKIDTSETHEELMWRVLEFARWGDYAKNWNQSVDYETIGKQMHSLFTKETLEQAQEFYSTKLDGIKTILEDHAEERCGKRHGYYGVGDDGFWDLRAHIIGLGSEFYASVVSDPEIAKRIADERSYVENFGYIFHYALPKER